MLASLGPAKCTVTAMTITLDLKKKYLGIYLCIAYFLQFSYLHFQVDSTVLCLVWFWKN